MSSAYKILSNDDDRKLYDAWLNSGIKLSFETWKEIDEETRKSFHWRHKNPQQWLEYNEKTQDSKEDLRFNSFSDSLISKFRNYEI